MCSSDLATLYINGAALVNDARVPRASAAIFAGDLLQTRPNSVANINEPGSSVSVLSDSLVKFEGTSVSYRFAEPMMAHAQTRATYTNISERHFTWKGESSEDGKQWTEFMVVECERE